MIRMMKSICWILLLSFCSCNHQIPFDKEKWAQRIDGFYMHREKMIDDVMDNHLKVGMRYIEIEKRLGKPNHFLNAKDNKIVYEILIDYGWDIDPVEEKNLFIFLSEDSTLVDAHVDHWEK